MKTGRCVKRLVNDDRWHSAVYLVNKHVDGRVWDRVVDRVVNYTWRVVGSVGDSVAERVDMRTSETSAAKTIKDRIAATLRQYYNLNITEALVESIRQAVVHELATAMSQGLLRTDILDRVKTVILQGGEMTDLNLVFFLDDVQDPEAILKMADWSYPSAEAVKQERAANLAMLEKEARAFQEEERLMDNLTQRLGQLMAESLEHLEPDPVELPEVLGDPERYARARSLLLNKLRSGGY